MQIGERYSKLLTLAKVDSSERRRELLHEVTDLFFESDDKSPIESKLFGELMAKVAFELDTEVRRELSYRFDGGEAPRELAVALANDEIDVAEPILRNTTSFTDDDLINIVVNRGQSHQIAVSKRDTVSERVSDALVDHGDDIVLASLLRNEGARIGYDTFDKVVVRAENNKSLHGPFVHRRNVPPEVLNHLYMYVDGPMRQEILERNKHLTPDQIQKAMDRAKARVGIQNGSFPEDFEKMQRKLAIIKTSGPLKAQDLPNLWRSGEHTLFKLMFAEICGIDYFAVEKVFNRQDMDALAMLCRAKNFERGLFVALAVFSLGDSGMSSAEKLGRMYNEVPQEAAARALRFMQVKMSATKAA